jgi:hypothetical protein
MFFITYLRCREARLTVDEALHNGCLIEDIKKQIKISTLLQVITICEETNSIILLLEVEHKWSWSWDSKGCFSIKSVYQMHFKTKIISDNVTAIWNVWAPLRCKIATWLFVRGRVWTADRPKKFGLPDHDQCVLCNATEENANHASVYRLHHG